MDSSGQNPIYAGLGSRFAALYIDFFVVFLGTWLAWLQMILASMLAIQIQGSHSVIALALFFTMLLTPMILWLGVLPYMESRQGATVGKRVLRITVVDLEQRPLSFRRSVGRWTLKTVWLSCFLAAWIILARAQLVAFDPGFRPDAWERHPAVGVVGIALILVGVGWVLTILFSPRRQAPHDWLTGSLVMRRPS
jgi:uncharacterized RDD family membrane protein YckC